MAPEKSNNPYFNSAHQFNEQNNSSQVSVHTHLSDEIDDKEEQPPAYTTSNIAIQTNTENPPTSEPTQESSKFAQSQSKPMKKPIAIPAVDSTFDSPFIRAYAPILKDYKLPQEVFFSFLDRLNKAISSSPPLQVLEATGGVLNAFPILFPLHWIGSAVSGIAKLGNSGMSKSRTDNLLKDANRDIFGPRGLKIEVAKLDALAHIAKIPILDSRGEVSRQAPLLRQLCAVEGRPESFAAPIEGNIELAMDAQQRRLQILQPWIADLELDILPWTSQSKLTRFNAALKKYNNIGDQEQKGKRRRERDSRQGFGSGLGGQDEEEEDDDPFRKCLWIIIREV
ncbi:hypothetical protein TMatcc_010219 [Talaromyces marneffei ATCC 18224]|uniref:Uncharacterized protein n=2 Tax=Talaromyces marneffei TaxID=37727 RepID=B6QW98_TALMQ|nr:uncharacterized protein EYB26_009974 [Talaromyces marneffei]EEA19226.1 conserved hypothetical protein [Talaromyces marneffei ATCC 18224]KAE8548917.1 hypothetical protein EYB25_009300 [Talaromyces marneffei]QGA22258.1 hypothetical protein EYB26_009974 [Talaromyces marneffei]